MHSVPFFRLRDSLLTSTFMGQTRNVVKRVSCKEHPEHDFLQIRDFHQKKAGFITVRKSHNNFTSSLSHSNYAI